jgi:2-(1,2-epoxy-1,2-dihydrophenyl)acetyl-CoA isomerase
MARMPDYELAQAFETVNLRRRGGIAKIELNRPETLNAWNKQFGADLLEAVRQVEADDGVRAVGIVGAGKGFSSGADLKAGFDPGPDGRPDVGTTLRERYHPIITGLRELPKPVLAAVHGPAVGIGLSLALAADLIVAAESAYFLLAFVNIGLVPDGGSSVFVPARVGFTRAIEMATLGERIPAPKALAWGLINRVHPDDAFSREVEDLLDLLAAGPTASYAGTKRQLNARVYAGMAEQLELEASIQEEMAGSVDFREGVTAFVEKREARFEGR